MFAADGSQLVPVPASQGALVLQRPQELRSLGHNLLPASANSLGAVPSSSYSVTETVSRVVRTGDAINNVGSAANQNAETSRDTLLGVIEQQQQTKRILEQQLGTEQSAKAALQQQLTTEQENHRTTKAQLAKTSNPSLIGIGCGAGNHILCGFFGVPKQYSEPICTVLAPILSAAMDHKDGMSLAPIVCRAALSFIACRGTIDMGNILNVASKIHVLKNRTKKDTLSEEEDESTEDTPEIKNKK